MAMQYVAAINAMSLCIVNSKMNGVEIVLSDA